MTQEGLSSNNEGQFSYQARYSRIELKELGRTVLVQYYVCSSNIPCVRVLGYYIQEGSTARVSGGQEFEDEMHLPANLKPIPEQYKGVIRLCVMANIAASLSIDPPLVQFLAAKKTWPTEP